MKSACRLLGCSSCKPPRVESFENRRLPNDPVTSSPTAWKLILRTRIKANDVTNPFSCLECAEGGVKILEFVLGGKDRV